MENESMWRKFDSLPATAKKEVIDFIDFLQSRYANLKSRTKPGSSSLSEEDFIGIWKDREDMTDSSEWVRDLRRTEWNK